MPGRAERIERIRVLLDLRRNPRKQVGILSATNLTRLVVRFLAMAAAAGAVHAVFGGTILETPLAAIAVGLVDLGVARLWKSIGDSVRQGWQVIAIIAIAILSISLTVIKLSPESGAAKGIESWAMGWLDRQNAKLDQRARGRRIPVGTAATSTDHWRVRIDSGAVSQVTYEEAQAWCREQGTEWDLPPGLGQWPALESYPDFGTIFYVWNFGHGGVQIGDGKEPAVSVSSSGRATEVRAALCLKRGA